jgi:hypothetical protein
MLVFKGCSMKKEALQQFIRSNGFAWPGGYPCALLMKDGETIDAQAARENYRQIRQAQKNERAWWVDSQWTPCEVFVHWEGEPLICAHSGRMIESAYGEVEA